MPTAALRITDWKKFSSREISDKDLWFFKRKLNFLKVRRNKFPSERVTFLPGGRLHDKRSSSSTASPYFPTEEE